MCEEVDVLKRLVCCHGQARADLLAVLTWCNSLHKQATKAAADVSKAHQLVVLLLARGGGLSGLTAALWVVCGPGMLCREPASAGHISVIYL